ncbi:hypothetical protein ALC57_08781 [Trachymyrmex cornetzi]|uniref:HAT C-terminal dimerisation domain-containing protein n=1 Tax=Trachymyrmex cornetzi TaxID=471704 RepID=A0A195E1C8_9HYME|nr:hypothetical protein ALC57_08781 [Trachymyrmex cornetzi]
MKKLSARWVPRLLTVDQKQQRVDDSTAGLALLQRNRANFFRRFETMAETWIHYHTSEFIRQSAEIAMMADKYNLVKTLFLCKCEKLYRREVSTNEEKNSSTSSNDEDFFHDFIKNSNTNNPIEKQNIVEMECLRYFEDKSKTVDSIINYNLIQKVFRQYNTILPSSVPVERLFSASDQILTPRTNRLSDTMFEILLMLKKREK